MPSKIPIEYNDKTILLPSQQSSIDAFLKALKSHSRRLQALLKTFGTEAQVLARVYYKGKNQHRSALFWRRVAELRRFAGRLQRLDIVGVVRTLRCTFFGPDAHNNPGLLKGPWTNYPNARFLQSMNNEFKTHEALLANLNVRSMDAYRSFSLAMQSGAFLQILLTLAAIASRTSFIARQLLETISHLSSEVQQLRSILMIDIPQNGAQESIPLNQDHIYHEAGGMSPVPVNAMETGSKFQSSINNANVSQQNYNTMQSLDSVPSDNIDISSSIIRAKIDDGNKQQTVKKRSTSKKLAGMAKRKKDEIDDIFGF